MRSRETKLYYKGTVDKRSDSQELLIKSGDFVIVKREVLRFLVLRCPCGCGDDLLINLDKRSGPAWRLYSKFGSYSLFPSYWRNTECGSHFVIWNNRIYWYSRAEEPDEDWIVDEEIERAVLESLNENVFTHYTEVADACGLIPWESLQACNQLREKGLCELGNGKFKDCFRRKS
jgi:hypothetical protein